MTDRLCSLSGCGKPLYSKGFCQTHYDKWHRYGDPHFVSPQDRRRLERNRGGERLCKDCRKWKPLDEFATANDGGKKRPSYQCKPCRTAYLTRTLPPPDPEKVLRRRRRWLSRFKKARLIRKEVMRTPDKETSIVWDGRGRWSRNYLECIECGSTLYRHQAKGICMKCYGKLSYDAMDEEARKQKIQRISELGTLRKKKDLELLEKAEQGAIPLTSKMENILAN
jgi:hypothetical protein